MLGKNENIKILFAEKHTKFGKEKYTNTPQIKTEITEQKLKDNNSIATKWLINKFNNCRYNSFITLFYFTISPFIEDSNEENIKDLKILNELIIKL